MKSIRSLSSLVLFLGTLFQVQAQSCPCGYKDSNGNLWRESILSDFTSPQGALSVLSSTQWIISTDFESQSSIPTATANIQYTSSNVFQHNDALGLKASAYDGGGSVKSAEIFTTRKDILYGTFRTRAAIPSTPGTVFGFFTFITDSQEQDIEFLSSDSNYYQHVHYTNQPGRDAGATQDVMVPGADFTAIGEHRIDWLPNQTIYYYKGNVSAQHMITTNVPTTPSEFVLNVWSNGDPQFSQGPPTADSIATIQTINLYFNSTTLSESQFKATCSAAGSVAACSV